MRCESKILFCLDMTLLAEIKKITSTSGIVFNRVLIVL